MSTHTTSPRPGCVVEFMHADGPHAAYVLDEAGGKLRLYTDKGREMKLPVARLLPWVGPCAGGAPPDRAGMTALLDEVNTRRNAIAHAVDVDGLWELAQAEATSAPVQFFAELLFDAPDVDQLAGVGRALLADKVRFKFAPPTFTVHSAEVVAEKKARARAERLREQLATDGAQLLEAVWRGDTCAYDDANDLHRAVASLLRTRMAQPDHKESAPLFKKMTKAITPQVADRDPAHVVHLPLLLARAWGLVGPHHNTLADAEGYALHDEWWREGCAGQVADLREATGKMTASLPAEDCPFVSVDHATTRDIDDGFVCERAGENEEQQGAGYRLRLAIACPAHVWTFDSELDQLVRTRASSVYLPEATTHMLPEVLATDTFSLLAGQPRPALVLDFSFDADGMQTDLTVRAACVTLAENTHYEVLEERIHAGEPHAATAHELAAKLRANRLAAGAVLIRRPEPQITLTESGTPTVDIAHAKSHDAAQETIAEFMVLANSACASWAAEQGAALFFRTQAKPLPEELHGTIADTPAAIHATVRRFGPTLTAIDPAPHNGLGVATYAPLTSPIRRYTDLLNTAQLLALVTTGAPRFTREEMEAMQPRICAASDATGRIQRMRPRYWKLVYLAERMEQEHEGVIVEDCGRFVRVSLPLVQLFVLVPRKLVAAELAVCAEETGTPKFVPGTPVRVHLKQVDPLTGELKASGVLPVPSEAPEVPEVPKPPEPSQAPS